MNAIAPTTEIAVLDTAPLVPEVVFAPGGVDALLAKLEADVRAVPTDLTTNKGRDAIKSLAHKVTRSKTALDAMGKALTEDWRLRTNAVNAERQVIRNRLDALAEEVRRPVTTWENAEKARLAGHKDALLAIAEGPDYGAVESSEEIALRLAHLEGLYDRDWQEFRDQAKRALAAEIARTEGLHQRALEREAAEAEALRLRLEAEEEARQAAIRAQAEREARIAEEARAAALAEAATAAQAAVTAADEARLAAEAREARLQAEVRQAEQDRVAAAEEAVRAREAAVAAERDRAALEEAQAALRRARDVEVAAVEARRRMADREHQAEINRAILTEMVKIGISEDHAKALICAIAQKRIPRLGIAY
jgi:colicin import membrane protein